MAVLIRVDGSTALVEPHDGPGMPFSAQQLAKYVGPDVGIIQVRHNAGMYIVANNVGKRLGLQVNLAATILYKMDAIVGDVLICLHSEVAPHLTQHNIAKY